MKALPDDGLGAGLGDLPLRPPAPAPPLSLPGNPSEVDGRCPGEPAVTDNERGTAADIDRLEVPPLGTVSYRPIPSPPALRRSLAVGDGT